MAKAMIEMEGKERNQLAGVEKMERQDVASRWFTRVAIATGNTERPPLITQP